MSDFSWNWAAWQLKAAEPQHRPVEDKRHSPAPRKGISAGIVGGADLQSPCQAAVPGAVAG